MTTNTNANGGGNGSEKGALSVFLVDDDNMFLTSLEHHLQQKLKHNFRIRSFPTGEVCLKNLEQRPDIVMLDYLLNGQDQHAMNGVQVLERIKLVSPATTVIMLSGQDKMQVAIDCLKHGALDYVVKNENVFLRAQNAIKNAVHTIKMAEQLKFYRVFLWTILLFEALVVAVAVLFSSNVSQWFSH